MKKDYDNEFGPISHTFSERENLTMLTFPVNDHVVLVTSEKDTSPISLAKQIPEAIAHCRKPMNVMVKQQG